MGRIWRKVEDRCMVCHAAVGKISIKSGKIVVDKYHDNWGCWQQVPAKSEMQVMCRICQKQANKLKRKKA